MSSNHCFTHYLGCGHSLWGMDTEQYSRQLHLTVQFCYNIATIIIECHTTFVTQIYISSQY